MCWQWVLSLVIVVGVSPLVRGQDGAPDAAALVAQLASPNAVPAKRNDSDIRLPADYDDAAQGKVLAAYEALLERGEAALPYLIASACDERYSATLASPSTEFNASVGYVCRIIVRAQLCAYQDRLPRGLGRWRPDHLPGDCRGLQQWWSENKAKPLWQLHVDVIGEAVEQLQAVDPENLVENYYAKEDSIADAIAESIATLKNLQKELNKSHTPLDAKSPIGDPRKYKMLGVQMPRK